MAPVLAALAQALLPTLWVPALRVLALRVRVRARVQAQQARVPAQTGLVLVRVPWPSRTWP
jgi:hypothetical protein